MIHIGLFEGIGGFSIAAREMGWKTGITCEIEPFPQTVLRNRFPNAYHHGDIHTLNYDTINTELSKRFGADWRKQGLITTGGFPCQSFSVAGARKGTEDPRYLWPEMFRIIQAVRPDYIIGENVPGLLSIEGGVVFEQVCLDLESEGYEVQAFVLPACATGAPHRRDRVWIVAYTNISRNAKQSKEKGIKEGVQREYREKRCSWLPYGTTGNDGITAHSNEVRRGSGLGSVSKKNGEVPEWNENAEFGNTNSGTTSDTTSNGHSGRYSETGGEKRESEQRGLLKSTGADSGITSDTKQKRCGGRCDTNSITEEREIHQDFGYNRNGIRSEIEGCGECASENPGSSGCNDGEYEQQGGIRNFGELGTGGNEWDINAEINSNTSIQGHKRSEQPRTYGEGFQSRKPHKSTTELHSGNYWHDWPSISPFHFGHDGLSPELVRHIRTCLAEAGETPENIEAYIRKESNYIRKEAIKCAGNAVVPTVVLQIMKAIQYHYENTND